MCYRVITYNVCILYSKELFARSKVGGKGMGTNKATLGTLLLVVGLVSACNSGSDSNSPSSTQDNGAADASPIEDTLTISAEETGGESSAVEVNPVESDPVESPVESTGSATGDSATQDVDSISDESSSETNLTNPQNDSEQVNADSQQAPPDSEAEVADSEQPVAVNQLVNFGTAKLLVDLEPNGDSFPAKFHRQGDQLFFWTTDTDPVFARCSYHWGRLNDDDKNIALSLVATHPETGVVAINREIMTVGDFADDANNACAGYNGTIMQVYEQTWMTTQSATGEQQFVVHFDDFMLGPDQVWMTDGSESNTSQLETGLIQERTIIEDDKLFFVSATGLSVADTLSGDRRKLFERYSGSLFSEDAIRRIVRSPARQATFEIKVAQNRYQIWTYDLDTDEWVKQFSIKPDGNAYNHYETLLVDGPTLLSLGRNVTDGKSALGFSSNYGDVTSFEILTDSPPSILSNAHSGTDDISNENSGNQFLYSTTDFSIQPRITSIWSYREEQIKNLFSFTEGDLGNRRFIYGHDGRIYVTGTRQLQQQTHTLELLSYDTQTGQLVELSGDDWFSSLSGFPSPDEGYFFRYLSTPDGLLFVNLKEDSGRELWFTDGSPEGTRLLADVNPGTGSSDPQNIYYSGDAVYFSADDGTHGVEPWMIPISR